MKSHFVLLLALMLSAQAAAQESYKCKTPSGYVYQDRPCAGVRYVQPPAPAPAAAASPLAAGEPAAKATPSDLERSKAYLASREKERRVNDLKYEITRQEESLTHSRQARDAEIYALQDRKQYARNNLAGATLEQSIATEMQAVTARYESDINFKQDKLKQLRDELAKAQQQGP